MSADLAKIRNWNREQQAQRIAELEAALAQRSKQIGVACLKHDLVHSLVCGICFSELTKQRDELLKVVEVARESCHVNFSGGFVAIRDALKELEK